MKLSSRGIAITFIIVCLPGLYAGYYGITVLTGGLPTESGWTSAILIMIGFILFGYLLYAGYIGIAIGRVHPAWERAIWTATIWYNMACWLASILVFGAPLRSPLIIPMVWTAAAIALAFRARRDLPATHPEAANYDASSTGELPSLTSDPSTPQPEQP